MPNQVLVQKFLPPENVMELYEEYKATQQMLGGHHVSHLVFYLSMWTNHVPSTQIRKLLEPRVSCEILRIVNLSTAGGNEWQTSYINIYLCIYICRYTSIYTCKCVYIYIHAFKSYNLTCLPWTLKTRHFSGTPLSTRCTRRDGLTYWGSEPARSSHLVKCVVPSRLSCKTGRWLLSKN